MRKMYSKNQVENLAIDSVKSAITSGDIEVLPSVEEASANDVLALNSDKEAVWKAISGGTQLYKHSLVVKFSNDDSNTTITYVDTNPDTLASGSLSQVLGLTSFFTYPQGRQTPILLRDKVFFVKQGASTQYFLISYARDDDSGIITTNTTAKGTATFISDTPTAL